MAQAELGNEQQNGIKGDAEERFYPVRDAMARNVALGEELGSSIAVAIDGQLVLDIWGGFRDSAKTLPWERDTVATVWSITKPVITIAFLTLVDRGLIDLDSPVAAYWPEFAANGKSRVLVREVLAHASGVSGLDHPATVTDLYDAEAASARMAGQAPWWQPGTASGYHLFNFGHVVGELVRRVTGSDLRSFVQRELAERLGVDFQIGAPESDWHRVAEIVPPPPLPFDVEDLDHDTPAYKTFTGPSVDAREANTPAWRLAQVGAANGHGNARSVASILSVLAEGGSSREQAFFAPSLADRALEPQTDGVDLVNELTLRWGLGFALSDRRTLDWIPEGRIGYWGGWGGSMGIVDLDRRLAVGYVMNRMGGDILGSDRAREYVSEVFKAVDR